KRGIIAGHGYRTQPRALELLSQVLEVPVLALKLVDERFYHLDTCLSPLSASTALWVPQAFSTEGQALLKKAFETLVEVPLDEATGLLACNGHSPDGRHFIVQAGATKTNAAVQALGLSVVQLDTSEFLKSGGSVYCMKLMLP
ncbi:MAG: dimethylarginine dimethylaminohydrolase family protein, partial [Myxococcota bacterium]